MHAEHAPLLQSFGGPQAGWYFSTGELGLGYYKDTAEAPGAPQHQDAQAQAVRALQAVLAGALGDPAPAQDQQQPASTDGQATPEELPASDDGQFQPQAVSIRQHDGIPEQIDTQRQRPARLDAGAVPLKEDLNSPAECVEAAGRARTDAVQAVPEAGAAGQDAKPAHSARETAQGAAAEQTQPRSAGAVTAGQVPVDDSQTTAKPSADHTIQPDVQQLHAAATSPSTEKQGAADASPLPDAAQPRPEHCWGQALQYLDRSAPIEPGRRLLLLAKRDSNQVGTSGMQPAPRTAWPQAL